MGVTSPGCFRARAHINKLWSLPKSQIITYVAFLSEQGYAPSTVSTDLAGISYKHKSMRWSVLWPTS